MTFDTDKCKVVQICDKNLNTKYKMSDHEFDDVKQEKYLSVIISNNVKTSDQCTAVSKVNIISCLASRNFGHIIIRKEKNI